MVDTALMGHLSSPIYLGAVGIGGALFNFLYWSLGFLRMGTTGLSAQAYGQGDRPQQLRILFQALGVGLGAAFLFLLFQWPIGKFGLSFFPAEEGLYEEALLYFSIRIWAAPATIGLYVFNGWFLGMQNARIPLIISVLGNILNILLSLYFVRELNMGVAGVAGATVMAQYLGIFLALGLWLKIFKRNYEGQWPELSYVLDLGSLKRFFSVNSDIFIRTVCLIFVFSFFTVRSTAFGPLILAANQILRQFMDLMAYGVDGFAFATESLVGRFVGEAKQKQLKEALGLLFIWGVGIGLVFSLVYVFLGESLLSIFTDQEDVLEVALEYLPWQFVIPLVGSVAYMYDGAYLGATASRPMRNMMVFSTLLVFLPSWYLGEKYLGNHGLWLSMLLFMLARGLSLGLLSGRHLRLKEE